MKLAPPLPVLLVAIDRVTAKEMKAHTFSKSKNKGTSMSSEPKTITPFDCNQTRVEVAITTDYYPGETTWDITNQDNGVQVSFGGPYETNHTRYEHLLCLPQASYNFTIYDLWGDGICCGGYGNGTYEVLMDHVLQASGGVFGWSESVALDSIPYRLEGSGNCTESALTNASNCEAAAEALGFQYQPEVPVKNRSPATMPGGCFAKLNNWQDKIVKVRWNPNDAPGANCGHVTKEGKFTKRCLCSL